MELMRQNVLFYENGYVYAGKVISLVGEDSVLLKIRRKRRSQPKLENLQRFSRYVEPGIPQKPWEHLRLKCILKNQIILNQILVYGDETRYKMMMAGMTYNIMEKLLSILMFFLFFFLFCINLLQNDYFHIVSIINGTIFGVLPLFFRHIRLTFFPDFFKNKRFSK